MSFVYYFAALPLPHPRAQFKSAILKQVILVEKVITTTAAAANTAAAG
jgi:hypothetical protein